MSDKFTFKNYTLSLTLCDQSYTLNLDGETIGTCDRIRSDVRRFIKRLNEEKTDTDAVISDICSFFEAAIDSILGKGATKTVFGTRPLTLLDLTDLLSFILAKVSEAVAVRCRQMEE